MIRVTNIKEAKAAFKKQFANDCTGTFAVTIDPEKKTIRVATITRNFGLRELYIPIETDYQYRKVTLDSVDKFDVLWNFIWDKNGFFYETYKDAYKGIKSEVKSTGHIATVAEVVFRTKTKTYKYFAFENQSVTVIE